MRALGKTPNDPLLQKMTPIQWHMCMMNVIEDEKENNKKISDIVDIAVRLFAVSPEGDNIGGQEGYIGIEPSVEKPDISYRDNNANVRKVLSTEFDKIIASEGKYKGFDVDTKEKEEK